MSDGHRMLIPCQRGPAGWRATTFPPSIEIVVDDSTPDQWSYEFACECMGR